MPVNGNWQEIKMDDGHQLWGVLVALNFSNYFDLALALNFALVLWFFAFVFASPEFSFRSAVVSYLCVLVFYLSLSRIEFLA